MKRAVENNRKGNISYMKEDVVYLKLDQCSQVVNRRITVGDVAEILATDTSLEKEIRQTVLYTVKGDKNEKLVFSSMKVIEMIRKLRPGIQVENIGETEFIAEYKMPVSVKKGWEYVKTALLFLIVFFGAAFTIMTFNTDVSVGDVFQQFYKLVTGENQSSGSVMEVAYSIGIGIGILGFYNHFSAGKIQEDPTPIHIEMRSYEQEMNQAVIQDASREGKIIK